MKYTIKTIDNKYWIGAGGEFITSNIKHRDIYENEELAQWYIDNTSLWGELRLSKLRE